MVYMHDQKYILENETRKIPWDFELQIDHQIPTRKTDQGIINNKKKWSDWIGNFAPLASHRVKIKVNEKRDKFSDLAGELKEAMEHKSNYDTSYNSCARNGPQRHGKGTEDENRRTSQDHSNDSIIKIGQNTEKSPGDLRRLTVTHTYVKDHLQTLVWNIWKE